MTLKELRELRAKALARARELAEAENFDQAAFDAAEQECRDINRRIKSFRQVAEQEALAAAEQAAISNDADRRGVSEDEAAHGVEAWLGSLGAWAREVDPVRGVPMTEQERLTLYNVDTLSDAAGGAAVLADGVRGDLFFERMRHFGAMLSLATVTQVEHGNKAHVPGVDDTNSYGRILSENSERQTTDVGFVKAEYDFDYFDSDWIKESYEAIQDIRVADMGRRIVDLAAMRCSRMMGWVFTQGKAGTVVNIGVNRGQPALTNGIAHAASDGVTTAANNAVTADEWLDLFDSLDPAYEHGSERAMFAKRTMTRIRKLKDDENRYLFDVSRMPLAMRRGVDETPMYGTIDETPFVLNNEMPPVAAGNVAAVYGDLSAYHIFVCRGVEVQRFHDSNTAARRQVWFGATARAAGVLVDTAAVKSLKIKP